MTKTELVAVDIGGTHARFARATVSAAGVALGEATTLATSNYPSLGAAWAAYSRQQSAPLPRAAAIALACPMDHILDLTNNDWTIDRDDIACDLGVDQHLLLNDFEAIAHAVAALPASEFQHLTGFDFPLPHDGVISVIGPGTGLGVAQIVRDRGALRVVATEGGHVGFAPNDAFDDELLAHLRDRHGRVSIERIVSGPGLHTIVYVTTGTKPIEDDATLWRRALSGEDADMSIALERFCYLLGVVAGDIALAQGARAVVIAGGLGLLLAGVLTDREVRTISPHHAFAAGFTDKGRFANRMMRLTVKVITHRQPGLFGAAAAFARAYGP